MALWRELPGKIEKLQNGFGGGVNTGLPPLQIPENQATSISNLIPKQGGAATVRGGRSAYGLTLSAAGTLLGAQDTTRLIAGAAATLYYWNGSAWTSLGAGFTSGAAWDYCSFMGYTWLVNGYEARKLTGTTLSTIGGSPPAGATFVKPHANRLFMLVNKRLSHSALRKGEDWTTAQDSGYIDMEPPNGENASALAVFGGKVIVFFDHSFYELYGTGPDNFAMIQASNQVGCIAHRTIQEIRGRLYWLGADGVYRFAGGVAPQKILQSIKGSTFDPIQSQIASLNWSQRTKANAAVLDDWYILAIPTGTNTECDTVLIYDTISNTWWPGDLGGIYPRQFVSFNDALYAIDSTGLAHQVYTGTTDGGTAISWKWVTKALTEGGFSPQDVLRVFQVAELPTGSTLSLAVSSLVEGDTDWTTIGSMTAASGYQKQRFTFLPNQAANKTWLRMKVSGTGPATLHELVREVRIKPWV